MKQLLRLNKDGKLALRSQDGSEAIIEQRPSIVLLLVDTSGSMAGTKIEQSKSGAVDFAQSANAQGYRTALAVFADRAAMVCDPVSDAVVLKRKIAKLAVGIVGGSTNLSAGLALADKFAELAAIVVVTDGACNDTKACLIAAALLKQRGIEIICIGTDDADRAFLSELSTRSNLATHVPAQKLRAALTDASRLLPRGKL